MRRGKSIPQGPNIDSFDAAAYENTPRYRGVFCA
jgi:hypothetical protein